MSRTREHSTRATADVPPLDVTGVRTLGVGTALWIVVGALSYAFQDKLEASGNDWWLWTCVTGIGLGLIGFLYCLRYRRQLHKVPRQTTDSPLGLP